MPSGCGSRASERGYFVAKLITHTSYARCHLLMMSSLSSYGRGGTTFYSFCHNNPKANGRESLKDALVGLCPR